MNVNLNAEALQEMSSASVRSMPTGSVASQDLSMLTEIYDPTVNLAIWRREPDPACRAESASLLETDPGLQLSLMTSPETVEASLRSALRVQSHSPLVDDMKRLVEMFCVLFDLSRVGVRLTALDGQMCPKFHIDRVPCRLITTYEGIATQWLPNDKVDRSKLGATRPGTADKQGGLYESELDIAELAAGDVALFKGEAWEGNEGFGVVHRSPEVPESTKRLLLTIDFGR